MCLFSRGCGCMGSILIGVLAGILVVVGFAGWWTMGHLLSKEPLFEAETSWNQAQELVLETKIKVAKKAVDDDKKEIIVLLSQGEFNRLVNQNLPGWFEDGAFKADLGRDGHIDVLYSRPSIRGRYLNIQSQGVLSADGGDYTVEVEDLKIGKWEMPATAKGEASHLIESILEKGHSIDQLGWRVKNLKIRELGISATVEVNR